ncbi:deaminated glutathione amidase [Pandoraea sp. XY-2]|uniref:deaminated glutathione amidase n=1 Tax=Pandoraea sp. XY-2 TaxID=2518599 RepID=UPI00101AFFB6|nr:deaminated glutathione amidase [Pandoraea sp. XY-2]QBC33030.1 deaminated glutathione amidase [Pandoraea sp. XY-2]
MKAAIGQFAVAADASINAQTCLQWMAKARAAGADLLVLPEGVLARDIADPDLVRRAAQPLDGEFVTTLREASRGNNLTTMMTVHVPATADGKVWNVLIALRDGEIIAEYKKIHLYDAFSVKESTNVVPGNEVPPLVDVCGLKVGLMTCYDVRFPELARRLTLDGADVLVLPAAWVRGPLKEAHWETLCTARALENTCYLVASGECGPRNIGASMVVDPLGVIVARAAEAPAFLLVDLDPARIAEARRVLPCNENRRFAAPQL